MQPPQRKKSRPNLACWRSTHMMTLRSVAPSSSTKTVSASPPSFCPLQAPEPRSAEKSGRTLNLKQGESQSCRWCCSRRLRPHSSNCPRQCGEGARSSKLETTWPQKLHTVFLPLPVEDLARGDVLRLAEVHSIGRHWDTAFVAQAGEGGRQGGEEGVDGVGMHLETKLEQFKRVWVNE